MSVHPDQIQYQLIEKYVQGRVPGHKSTDGAHQYKDFHRLKTSGCYHFNAKRFQTFILLLLHGQIPAFDIFCGCFLLISAKAEVEWSV